MKTNSIMLLFQLMTLLCCENALLGICQPRVQDKNAPEKTIISASGELIRFGGGIMGDSFANIELNEIEPNRDYHLEIDLKNGWVNNLEFDNVKSNCACANVFPRSGTIVADKSLAFALDFRSPASTRSGKYAFSVALYDNKKQVSNVNFRLNLASNLHIPKNHQVIIRSSQNGKKSEAFIPITITKPLNLNGLKASVDDSLSDFMRCSVVDLKEKGPFVHLDLHGDEVPDSLAAGQLKLVHQPSGINAECSVLVRKIAEIGLSPKLVHFHDEKSGELRAKAILELGSSLLPEEPDADWSKNVSFETNNDDLTWELKRLTPSLYRVIFILKKRERDSDESESNSLLVQVRSKTGTIASAFFEYDFN